MWFEKLMGFKEETPRQVRKNIELNDKKLISRINKKEYNFGALEIPSLENLRNQINLNDFPSSKINLSEAVGDIQEFHKNIENNNSVIQVASQFNLLEMVSPNSTPEEGVGIYQFDATQGPACDIACGAGTIYRNYFADVDGQIGQSSTKQIDCLSDIGIELKNEQFKHWEMKNGYALASREGLKSIQQEIASKSKEDYHYLKGKLRVGVQWDSEVTISTNNNKITQVYCSALPVSYSSIEAELWSDFAKLILEATYEATFYIALQNFKKTGNNKLFLSLIGGGAFGNNEEWIFSAISKSIKKFYNTGLDVKIVSYANSNSKVVKLINSL